MFVLFIILTIQQYMRNSDKIIHIIIKPKQKYEYINRIIE